MTAHRPLGDHPETTGIQTDCQNKYRAQPWPTGTPPIGEARSRDPTLLFTGVLARLSAIPVARARLLFRRQHQGQSRSFVGAIRTATHVASRANRRHSVKADHERYIGI